ncbi:myrosinase 1-like [Thrips palmi]|uniref:Myrosinase 1-like n=1 Tax=Thrips palmi TaxID=161013 RepID=A0A6P8ZQM8_THRPL|nr:myrosinase 1-like [Thrips palmi]
MATHIVLLLAVAAVAVEAAVTTSPRTLKPKSHPLLGASLGATADATQDCQSQLARCTDCTTLLTCTRLGAVYRPLTTTTCSGTTPYCSNGACVATLPDDCSAEPTADTTFTCNGDGYFPSPSSCQKYYLCANNQAYAFDCTPYKNTVFSYEKALCVPSTEATCNTVACNNNNVGTYQQWRSEHSVYFVCTDNNAAHAYVADCGANHAITADGDCALACLREGRLPDESSPDRYFECIQTATNTFTDPIPGTCPAGTTFDVSTERCVSTGTPDDDDGDHPEEDLYEPRSSVPESMYQLPADLKIGTASAAYQIEGAWNEDGKSPSIWDVFFHSRPGMDNGDVADDSYHKWQEDVQLLVDLGVNMYRFSMAWTRVLPGGSQAAGSSPEGVAYYDNLINELLRQNIEPVITLHHWDIPQLYQDDGGWMTEAIQDRFLDYADFAFKTFGDRVKTWLLLNEPHVFCNGGYEGSSYAPGLGLAGTGGYTCVHNMILAHAKAYHLYNDTYRATQGGQVGSSFDLQFHVPASDSPEDVEAAERSNVFTFAWIADPVMKGDYPALMREIVDRNSFGNGLTVSRLPTFTAAEKALIVNTMDFIGLNHYSISLTTPGTATAAVTSPSMTNDTNVRGFTRSSWLKTARGSFVVAPWGFRAVLNWIKDRYDNFPVLVTENGYAGAHDEYTSDPGREGYYSTYMRALARAINEDGCNVIGYTAWCLEDNLEWSDGFSLRFGLAHVDYDDPNRPRVLKNSARLFRDVATTKYARFVQPV